MDQILSFQQFSDLNSVGVAALLALDIIVLVLYFTNNKFKNLVSKISYQSWMTAIIAIVAFGVVGANMYEYVYNDPPCMFCWYQRVTIYGMLLIAIVEVFEKTRAAHHFISIFAALTTLVATYHYSFHFRKYVMGESALTMPCSPNPLVASCESAKVVSFGFVTMPLMSVIVGLTVLLISYFAYKKAK